jgi:SAM-dependent methyltransferase
MLDDQHRYPTGLFGHMIGERMVHQHAPETAWTINQLHLESTDRVLELGCGAGRGLALASQQVGAGYVVGLDRSSTMLRAATRRNQAALRAARVALLRGDFAALPFEDGSFDKILSIHTFYFWPNPLDVCADLAGLLKHGGRLVVTLATGQRRAAGTYEYWPLHEQVEAVVQELQQSGRVSTAALYEGPNSRQYNNIAIVVQK